MGRPIEFRRFKKDKDSKQQFPTFFKGDKEVYAIRSDEPATEQAILKELKLIAKVEKSESWTSPVQETLNDRKSVLLNALMQRRLKNG